jgi:hypothetical protein
MRHSPRTSCPPPQGVPLPEQISDLGEDGAYCDYLATEAACQGRLWAEVSGRRWRHWYMRVHATKQARYDRFCTRLEEVARKAVVDEEARARPIVIAYGAGKFSFTLKHNRPVPTGLWSWSATTGWCWWTSIARRRSITGRRRSCVTSTVLATVGT